MIFGKKKTHTEWALDNLTNDIEQYLKAVKKDEENLLKEKMLLLNKYAPTINQDSSGIYAIQIDGKVLYVGQSMKIVDRVLAHIFEIADCVKKILLEEQMEKKYKILATAILTGHKLEFIVLCECNRDKQELNEKEMYYINLYNAPLNTYRPKRHEIPDTLEEALAFQNNTSKQLKVIENTPMPFQYTEGAEYQRKTKNCDNERIRKLWDTIE